MGGMIQSMELISTVFSPALHSYKPQIQPNHFEKTEHTVARNFGKKIHRGEWIFALLILSGMNVLEEYLTKSLSLSKLYVPQKFTEMLSKFCSGQEFVEKLGILANFVNKCLHYFWTIL